MRTFFRTCGAMGIFWMATQGAVAASSLESAFELPQWSESCSLPSVTSPFGFVKDSAVRLASKDEPTPAAEATTSDNCATCDSGCNMNSCCCGPSCYGYVGAVFLHRSRPDSGDIIIPQLGGATALGAQDFDFDWGTGVDVGAGRRIDCCYSWEARYFNSLDTNASLTQEFAPPGDFFVASFAPGGVSNVDSRYTTDLHSAELNLRRETCGGAWLYGFRYLEVEDDLTMDFTLFSSTTRYNWNESNYLYGLQLGRDFVWTRACSPLSFNSVFKGGIYGVSADNGFTRTPSGGGETEEWSHDSDVAFVGEIDLIAHYRLTNHVGLRGGYQLLWIEGVALASDQAVNATAAGNELGIDSNGGLFYHGATAAVEFFW